MYIKMCMHANPYWLQLCGVPLQILCNMDHLIDDAVHFLKTGRASHPQVQTQLDLCMI